MGALDYSQKPKHYVGPGLFEKGKPAWNRNIKQSKEHTQNVSAALKNLYYEKDLKNPKPWHSKEWLDEHYITNGESFNYIGKTHGSDPKSVRRWAEKFGLPIRNKSESTKMSYVTGHRMSALGPENPKWRGGRGRSGKYNWVYVGKGKVKLEHIAVVEEALGRPLEKWEVVHHINMNGRDNRIDNLLICDHSFHKWCHWWMEKEYCKEHFEGA